MLNARRLLATLGLNSGETVTTIETSSNGRVAAAAVELGLGSSVMLPGFKYLHVGTAGKLQVSSKPPLFDTFSGQVEACIGTLGRCAACKPGLAGGQGRECERAIRANAYAGFGRKNNFVRAELFSSLRCTLAWPDRLGRVTGVLTL